MEDLDTSLLTEVPAAGPGWLSLLTTGAVVSEDLNLAIDSEVPRSILRTA